MAKTGDTSKGKPKARRPRTARPSFTAAAAAAAAATPPAAQAAPGARAAAPRRGTKAPVAAVPAPRASRVTRAMDIVTLPIAVSLMAVLAPMRWLLGPASHD